MSTFTMSRLSSSLVSVFSAALFVFPAVLGQVFVGSNSSEASVPLTLPAPEALSSSCKQTFATNVTCDTTLPLIAFYGHFPDDNELARLCKPDCFRSLEYLGNLQQKACASDVMDMSGEVYPVTTTVDSLLWTFNYTCLRDPASGDFCAPVFDAWANGNASQQSCSDCVLGTYQRQLSNPLGYTDDLAASFSSLMSSCHATNYPVTSPPPGTVSYAPTSTATTTPPSVTPSKGCSSTYTVQEGDDCHSISVAQQVSTNDLLYLNNLEAGCTDFPGPGTQLCMPHPCQIYTVQENDTCYGIVQSQNNAFTISQLASWNIDINRGCDNLEQLVGDQICISFPGNTSVPTQTAAPTASTPAPVPTNVVSGTKTRCARYYTVVAGDSCALISQREDISLPDFYFLNPEINSTCGNLFLGYSYCVQAVGNINSYPGYGGQPTNPCVGGTAPGPSNCYATTYATAAPWTFPAIPTTQSSNATATSTSWTSYKITPVTPWVDTRTPRATPTPHQSGMVSGCTDFYAVQSGDTCHDIAQRWQISLADLYAWNPALNGDCSGLFAEDFICVQRGSAAPTSTTTTTTAPGTPTGGGTPPPGPTQSGIPADCNKWVLQQDGVYCQGMANNAGISLSCLYQMNPALNTDKGECQGLWAGEAYCVGTASNVCT